MSIYPENLKPGDEIRIICPSTFKEISSIQKGISFLQESGYKVSLANNYKKTDKSDLFDSTPLEERVDDFNEAFADENVSAVIPASGGYNANQLLPFVDFQSIKDNPKIFCGFSDITVLNNALYTKTGLVTYSGPMLSTLSNKADSLDFTHSNFIKAISTYPSFEVDDSSVWFEKTRILDESFNIELENTGRKVIRAGEAEGILVGGNLCSLNLLHGTEYMPDLTDKVLFIEDDFIFAEPITFLKEFERNLVSLIQQQNFEKVGGLMIGRFEKKSGITLGMIDELMERNLCKFKFPIIANLDFGHTLPIITLPIGGLVEIKASGNKCSIIFKNAQNNYDN